jgi:hypothetical protein
MWKDVLARSKHENEVDIKFSHIEAREDKLNNLGTRHAKSVRYSEPRPGELSLGFHLFLEQPPE